MDTFDLAIISMAVAVIIVIAIGVYREEERSNNDENTL